MPRNIDPVLLTALSAKTCWPVHLLMLTFRSATRYVWSGVGELVWGGKTFLGVGSLGALGDVKESSEVRADGSSVMLSGIDPVDLAESLMDIRLGAPAVRWLGAVLPGTKTLIGTPYPLFVGQVDKPSVYTGPEKIAISLALESRMINHARASNRRLTLVDQHANGYPDDIGLGWVEILNDVALLWGAAS